jgi:hypothetical protein
MATFKYDVCLSFAGEDRQYVESVASALRTAGIAVFYDRYHETDLWGKNLYEHLSRVYRDEARYCIMFISRHYAAKLWTSHERRSAQERAFRESEEYILPVRFDDTEVPGLSSTTGYLDVESRPPKELAALIVAKLKPTHQVQRSVPHIVLDSTVLTDLLSEESLRILPAYERISQSHREAYLGELRRRMHENAPSEAAAAMVALFYLRDRDLGAQLLQLGRSSSPTIRRRAIFYLGELRYRQSLPFLSSAMSDPNLNVRAAAGQALFKISGRKPQ